MISGRLAQDLSDKSPACAQVFDVPELLEHILHFCRPIDFYITNRVSRSWHSAIENSAIIQRILFKRPLAGPLAHNHEFLDSWGYALGPEASFNPFTINARRSMPFLLHPIIAPQVYSALRNKLFLCLGRTSIFVEDETVTVRHLDETMFSNLIYKDTSESESTTPSWSNTLVSQPPARRAIMDVYRYGDNVESNEYRVVEFRLATIRHPTGITLGMIYRELESYIKEHRYPSDDYFSVELTFRLTDDEF